MLKKMGITANGHIHGALLLAILTQPTPVASNNAPEPKLASAE
jgi:hypothetical protein